MTKNTNGVQLLERKPLYLQVRQIIQQQLESGEYKEGHPLFTEQEFCQRYQVSRTTIRQAISELVRQGFLYQIPGKGTFVASDSTGRNGLKTKTGSLGVIYLTTFGDITSDPFIFCIYRGIQKSASLSHYNILSFSAEMSYSGQRRLPRFIRERKIDGLILLGESDGRILQTIEKITLPHIFIDYYIREKRGKNIILPDNKKGIEEAVKYLEKLGHRKIGIINGSQLYNNFRERREGYQSAFKKFKLPWREKWHLEVDIPINKQCLMELKNYFARPELPTAILIAYDRIAVECLKTIKARGLRIPEDISIIGFDDLEWSVHTEPPLTTIKVFREKMGELAVENLLKMIEEGKTEVPRVTVPTELIIRESCKKNKGR